MKKKLFFLAAMMTAIGMNLQAADPVSYLYPEYNTSGDPKSGIKEWKTGSCTEYTVVTDASSAVTWNAGWYIVNGADVKLSAGAVCNGAVNLILVDGAKLTANGANNYAGITVSGDNNSLTIYGQANQTGKLIATGGDYAAGIGGGMQGSGSDITINGGEVTATGSSYAAGIGGGFMGSGSKITINGGVVTAMGDNDAAGIGGGAMGSGSNITINGGEVTANSNGANGIGCGSGSVASNIFVNPSLLLKADNTNPPTTVIAHATITTDVASLLAGKQYATAKPVYKITTSVNKSDRGYTTPRDTAVFYGDTVIIRAEAYYGYHFTRWNKTNDSITDNPLKVVVTKDTNYQAVFSHNKYELTVSASGPGSVTGSGSYAYKYTTTITATPNPNCQFIQWNDGNKDNPRDITLTQDTAFVASFSVCRIGTKGYASIAAALEEVKAGDTIQVLDDIQLDAAINVTSSTPAFTLDLNGHILDGSTITGNHASLIRNAGTLSIIDSNPTATHEAPFDTIQGAIMTGGKGILLYGTITCGGAIYNYGAFNVTGVTFVNNTAYYGGVVFAQGGTVAFTNCRFYGESSKPAYMGSAIYLQTCQCTIDSCIIKDYSATSSTIYDYQSSLTIAHTTLTGNKAVSGGVIGGIYVKESSLTLNDGTVITNNTNSATFPCAGIYVWAAAKTNSITLSGKVIIKDNTTNGKPANLCLSGKLACDTVALNGLSAGSEVNVCTMINDTVAPATFATNATEADMQYFKSDNGYAIVRENTNLATKDTLDYLHFISLKENCSVQLNVFGNPDAIEVEYSKDNRKSWNNLTFGTAIDFDNAGDTIWFRAGKNGIPGTNATFSNSVGKYYYFAFGANDSIAAGGNTMSLLDATCELKTMPIAGFTYLFKGATQLISAPELPATTLASSCYNSMFKNSGLVVAPELPATILDKDCYYNMFLSCANLETAPDSLPADSLTMSCYMAMFMNCAKLKNAPVMKIKVLGRSCFSSMFQGCTSLQVDTIDGNCDGAELTIPTTSAPTWNSYMFKDCHEYAITQLGGSYCISEWKGPRAVELKSVDSTRVYDGTPFVADSVIITGQMNRNNIQFKNFASRTSVGQQPNTFEYTLLMGSAADYAFDTVYGTLKVDFINSANDPIRVKIDKNEKTYDGEPLFASYSVEGGLAQGDSMALVMDTTYLVDAGYVPVKAMSQTIYRGDVDITQGYIVAPVENGSLQVNPRELVFTSGSDSKPYDGTALTNDHVEVSGDGFIDGENATFIVTGTRTQVGVSTNIFTYILNEGTKEQNYDITKVNGTLTITSPITAQIDSMYEGWNIVFHKSKMETDLADLGIEAEITPLDVRWYIMNGDQDEFNPVTGLPMGDDVAADPATGFFHTEDKAMVGSYYVIVHIEEAKETLGVEYFISNIIELDAPQAPARTNAKYIHNGTLIIESNGNQYNAQGMKL